MSTSATQREEFDAPATSGDSLSINRDEARRAVRLACIVVLAVVLAGLLAIPQVNNVMFAASSLFFQQFAEIEAIPLALIGVFVVWLLVLLRRPPIEDSTLPQWQYRPWLVWIGAAAVVLIALGGIRWVFHGYFLADDEYAAWFQALIFARGKMSATVPADWCRWITPLTPTSIYSSPQTCTWRLSFLPIHSLMQAPFIAAGVGRLGVPLLSGLSVVLVASIARKLWPSKPMRAYVAALFMVTSTQVLFMSMTMFSMVTHLFFSLIWLWLYVDDRRWSNVLMPWIGVVAIGVHSPFPHVLFAAAFILRYLWAKRFAMFAYVSVVYALGLMYWYGYLTSVPTGSVTTVATARATAAVSKGLFILPSLTQGITTAMHLALVASWNAPVVIVLAAAAMLAWKRLDTFSRDAALSVIVILVARTLMPTSQGEGWGYRFAYDGLASLALLSSIGLEVLARAIGAQRAKIGLCVSVAAALAIQLPLRSRNVRQIVGPYQRGFAWMESLDYDAVVYPTLSVLWGRQLVQNDPFLRNRPLIVSATELSAEQYQALLRDSSKRVFVIPADSIRAHGFPPDIVKLGSIWIRH